jgi:hypothetical protein
LKLTHYRLTAGPGARVSSKVNGTTAGTSHICGKTGVRQIIKGSTEYGAYSWAICGWTWNNGGWTWNNGLNLTVASWAIAAEVKMKIDPAARVNCKDFRIVFLRRFLCTHRRIELPREFIIPPRRRSGGVAACGACQQPTENDARISAQWRLSYLSAADFGASNSV